LTTLEKLRAFVDSIGASNEQFDLLYSYYYTTVLAAANEI